VAELIINESKYNLEDGSSISEICQSAGVLFNCNTGVCGSCQISIVDGHENLNNLTEEELDLGLDIKKRLACMCIIKNGIVKITF